VSLPATMAAAISSGQLFSVVVSMGIGAATSALSALARTWYSTRKAQRASEIQRSEVILNSGDLSSIGDYLMRELGTVSASAYVSDDEVRRRVNASIGKVASMVALAPSESPSIVTATSESLGASATIDVPAPPSAAPDDTVSQPVSGYMIGSYKSDPDPLPIREALAEIAGGKYWNALFGLRRDLEMRLRERSGAPVTANMGVYFVDGRMRKAYQTFFRTASRAIHGEAVSDDDLQQAIDLARSIYKALNDVTSVRRDLGSDAPEEVSRVNLNEEYEVRYWAKKFGVTDEELRSAADRVGADTAAIHHEIVTRRSRRS
jgi:hypothetical protein